MKRSICIFVASIYISGCTTLTAVPYSQGAFETESVRPDDRVVLTTTLNTERHLYVTSVTPEQICGKDDCVPAATVVSIQKEEFSVFRTAVLVLGVSLLLGAAAASGPLHGGLGSAGSTCLFCGF